MEDRRQVRPTDYIYDIKTAIRGLSRFSGQEKPMSLLQQAIDTITEFEKQQEINTFRFCEKCNRDMVFSAIGESWVCPSCK